MESALRERLAPPVLHHDRGHNRLEPYTPQQNYTSTYHYEAPHYQAPGYDDNYNE